MQSKNLLLLLATGVLALAGCTSTPTRVDRGPIQARTFNFIQAQAKSGAEFADQRPDLQVHVQQAIEKNLTAKGLACVPNGGDVTVGYLLIVSEGATTRSINDYFGYGEAAMDLQEKAHDTFVSGKQNPTPYPAGTLVIDLVDSKSYKLLQRNYVCRPVLRQLPTDQRLVRLQSAVDEALQKVRVTK